MSSDLELRGAGRRGGPAGGSRTAGGPSRRRLGAPEIVAAVFAIALVVAALAPGLVSPYDPVAVDPRAAFEAPGLAHPFGTDESGRDILSRVIHGTGQSLLIGVAATAIGLGLGGLLGFLAGLAGRVVDFTVNRVLEVFFAFPGLLLALVVIVVAGPGPVPATIAVGLSTAPGYARIIRGQLLRIRGSAYVEAARVIGHPPLRILLRHIVPNTVAPLVVLATLGIGQAVVWASALSYLGLGAQPPAPEWGAMLSAGRTYIATGWWMTVFPGLVIVATTIASTVLGRALQRRGGAR